MKLTYTTKNNRIRAEFDAQTQTDMWEQLSSFQEVFEETACGKCGSENLRFVVREVDDNKYYELRCLESNCRARLSFGCHKKGGGLFPKRKDENGVWKGDSGWTVWNAGNKKEE